MEFREKEKRTCVFCGKEREVEVICDDGVDFYGHQRSRYTHQVIDDGCDCQFGKLNQAKIKSMCMNCKFQREGYCTNEKTLNDVSAIFDVGEKLLIKNKKSKCRNWSMNYEVFEDVISFE